jgi:hypothetical protein
MVGSGYCEIRNITMSLVKQEQAETDEAGSTQASGLIEAPEKQQQQAAPSSAKRHRKVLQQQQPPVIYLDQLQIDRYFSDKLIPLVEKQRDDYSSALLAVAQAKDSEIRAAGAKSDRVQAELEEASKKIQSLELDIGKDKKLAETLARENAQLRSQCLKLQRDTDYLYATCHKCGQYYQWKRPHTCEENDLREYNKNLKDVSHTSHPHTIWIRD